MSMHKTYINEVATALANNHAAVMVGSGFSKNAEKINVTNSTFLDWNQLSDLFYGKLYGGSENPGKNYNNPLRLAQEVEVTLGRPSLEELLHKAVPDQDYGPSDLFVRLMELPWKDVFTTNYDTLLERAAEQVTNRRYNIILTQNDIINSNETSRIVKLHGSFPSTRPFIITEEDYRTYPIKSAAFVNTVQQSLLENVFCMLGFSCEDPNFISWIGWIHDHLGINNSQKIYMISVTHVEEAKKIICSSRNIVIIDLEELWEDKSINERLCAFFYMLKEQVNEKNKAEQWFNSDKVLGISSKSFCEKTQLLKDLRLSYPGWIYIPHDLRKRTNLLIQELAYNHKLREIPLEEQIEYIYEYVSIYNIIGCPLFFQDVLLFYNIICDATAISMRLEQKVQTIFLQLLRAFRENAEWDRFDDCLKHINQRVVSYDDKQFLYAELCRKDYFCFDAEALNKRLKEWNISDGDIYWPMIRASLMALDGNSDSSVQVLTDSLVKVRRQLMKNMDNVYLASVEESVVSLLNYIRQGSHWSTLKEFEATVHEGTLSWWNDNEKYCSKMSTTQLIIKERDEYYTYNLKRKSTWNFGGVNEDAILAMEYWRFCEQTGHSFRIGHVTSAAGLKGSIERLSKYYPYWSFIQILTAADSKLLNYLYGRVQLASKSVFDIDEEAKKYIDILKRLIQRNRVEDKESIYYLAAEVLPEILARLCYKCSSDILDEILDMIFQIRIGDRNKGFRKIDDLLAAVMNSYSEVEQYDRLEKLLDFPYESDQRMGYYDPLLYLSDRNELIKIKQKQYLRVMIEINQGLASENKNIQEDALNRLLQLNYIIQLSESDRALLIEHLKEEESLINYYRLYKLETLHEDTYANKIIENTFQRMKDDVNEKCLSIRRSNYKELIWILKDIKFEEYDTDEFFFIITELLEASKRGAFSQEEAMQARIREAIIIAIAIVIQLSCKENRIIPDKESKIINDMMQSIKSMFGNQVWIDLIYKAIYMRENLDEEALKIEMWVCDDENLDMLKSSISLIKAYKLLEIDSRLNKILTWCSEVMVYRLLNVSLDCAKNIIDTLKQLVCTIDLNKNLFYLVNECLRQMDERTRIINEDSEQRARLKIIVRESLGRFAYTCYKRGMNLSAFELWKINCTNKEEFSEIRRIIW